MRLLSLFAAALTLSASAHAGPPAFRMNRLDRKAAAESNSASAGATYDGVPGRPVEPAAEPLTQERRAELEDLLGRWRQTQRTARAMVDELEAAYRGDPQEAQVKAWTAKMWGLVEQAGAKIYEKTDSALKLIPESEKAKREALEKLTLARVTRLYGNIVPRVLDESVMDPSGRRLAREFIPSWALALSEAEADAIEAEYKEKTGLAPDALGRFPQKD